MESLLTSHSTYLYNQINFMTSQGAIKVGEPFWRGYDSERKRVIPGGIPYGKVSMHNGNWATPLT